MQNRFFLVLALSLVLLSRSLMAQDHVKLKMGPGKALTNLPADIPACFAKEKLDTSKMTDTEKQILSRFQDGKAVPFNLVTDAWVDLYLRQYNKQHKSNLSLAFTKGILTAVPKGADKNDVFQFKTDYEDRLKTLFAKSELKYNYDYSNPLEMLFKNKMQCTSGTMCYSMAARLAWGSELYSKRSPVMIFTKGHVLPGFILEDEKGMKRLEGVESTGKGYARKTFGPLSELEKSKDAVRIIDSETFAVLDILAPHLSDATMDCLQERLQQNLYKQLGLDHAKLEARVQAEAKLSGKGKSTTPFGFGTPDVKKGDQDRADYGENPYRPKDKGPIIPHAPRPSPIEGKWQKLRSDRRDLLNYFYSGTGNRDLQNLERAVFQNRTLLNRDNTKMLETLIDRELGEGTNIDVIRGHLEAVLQAFPATAQAEFFQYLRQVDQDSIFSGLRLPGGSMPEKTIIP